MALLTIGAYYQGAGGPSGVQAGQVGDRYKDTNVLGAEYICTVAGNPATWQLVASGTALQIVSNLGDLTNVPMARSNLGLGTAAVQNVAFFAQAANNLSDLANVRTANTNLYPANAITTTTVMNGTYWGANYLCTGSSSLSITLPPVASSNGKFLQIISGVTGGGIVTISPASGTISGLPSIALAQNNSVNIYCDGTNYYSAASQATPLSVSQFTSTTSTLTGPMGTITNQIVELSLVGNIVTAFIQGGSFNYVGPDAPITSNFNLGSLPQFLPVRDLNFNILGLSNANPAGASLIVTHTGNISMSIGTYFGSGPLGNFSGAGNVGFVDIWVSWLTT